MGAVEIPGRLSSPLIVAGAVLGGFLVADGALALIAEGAGHLAATPAPSPTVTPSPTPSPTGPRPMPMPHTNVYQTALLMADAKTLGISVKDLKADFAQGTTLRDLAAARDLTEASFRSSLIKNLTPLLDQAAAEGKLTAEQERKILERLQSGPIPYWDQAPQPKATPSPAATPAQLS